MPKYREIISLHQAKNSHKSNWCVWICSWKPLDLGFLVFLKKDEYFPNLLPATCHPKNKSLWHPLLFPHFFQEWMKKGHCDTFSAVSLQCDLMTRKSEEQPPDWPCPTGRLPILGEHRPISLYCSSCSEFSSFILPWSCWLAACSWHKCPTAVGTTMLGSNWWAPPWPPALTTPCSQTGQSTGPWMK